MLKAPRPRLNGSSTRPQSNINLATRRQSRDTSQSNQNFSNRPWTSNATANMNSNKNIVNIPRIPDEVTNRQSENYFKKMRALSSVNQAMTPKPPHHVQRELFGNPILQQKKTSLLQINNINNFNKSPTSQTNVTGTTGTVRFLSKAMDAAVNHGQTVSKKRIIFTQQSQKRPQTSIRIDSNINKRDKFRFHPQTKSYESANFLNRNPSSQIDFLHASEQTLFRKNQQLMQAHTSHRNPQKSQKFLPINKRQMAGQSNLSGKQQKQDSSRSLIEYFDKQSNKPPGTGIRMRKIKMVNVMHAKRQTVAEIPITVDNNSGRATPSFLTSKQAIDKYRNIQSITPCVITDATMSQRGLDNSMAGSKQADFKQRYYNQPDSFEQRSRSTVGRQVFLAAHENMSHDNLRHSQQYNNVIQQPYQQQIVLNQVSQSQINASVFSNEVTNEDEHSRNQHNSHSGTNINQQFQLTANNVAVQEQYQVVNREVQMQSQAGFLSQKRNSSRVEFEQDYQSEFKQGKTNKIMFRKFKQTNKNNLNQRSLSRYNDSSIENDAIKLNKGILAGSNTALSHKQFGVVQESNKEVEFRFNEDDYEGSKKIKQSTRNNSHSKYSSQERHQKGSSINVTHKIKQIQLKSRNVISRQLSNDVNNSGQTSNYRQNNVESPNRNRSGQTRSNLRERSQSVKTHKTSKSPERSSLNKSDRYKSNMTPKTNKAKNELLGRLTQQDMNSQRMKNRSPSPSQPSGRLEQQKQQKMKPFHSFKQVSINITPRIPQMNQKEKHEVVEHSRNSSLKQTIKNNLAEHQYQSHQNTKRLILPDGRVKSGDELSDKRSMDDQQQNNDQQNEQIYDQSIMVQEMNSQLHSNMGVLTKIQNFIDNYDPEYEKLKQLDPDQVLQDASKQIKIIKYQCNNAVVQDDQRHILLKTPAPNDGAGPGPETVIDIIENCPLACKIEVLGRRMPLNIHINYSYNIQTKENNIASPDKNLLYNNDGNQNSGQEIAARRNSLNNSKSHDQKGYDSRHSSNSKILKFSQKRSKVNLRSLKQKLKRNLPELHFYISDHEKLPDDTNSIQIVKKPGTRFTIKYDKNLNTLESEKRGSNQFGSNKPLYSKNHYDFQYFYLNIMCEQGCTIGISCSFPEQIKDAPRNLEGAMGDEYGLQGAIATNKINEKDFRAKIKNEINSQMEELLNDMKKQKDFFLNLDKMKKEQLMQYMKSTDINFIQKNTNVEGILDEQHQKFINAREINMIRTQQAIIRKQSIEDERLEKIKFDMLKWDLYRLKCEDIEERHAQFKKLQMKILWWNQIIARHRMSKKAKWNFDEHLKKVITAARNMLKAFKIQYHFKKYRLAMGQTKDERYTNKVRYILTFLHLSKFQPPQDRAQSVIYQFLYKRQVEQDMQKTFRVFWLTANKINMKLKDIRMARECKKELILQYFLRELKILQKYYYEKSRIKSKNKKEFTKKQLDLVNMKPESRDIVLKYYYDYYIAYTNIKAAIHWCAIDGVKKKTRRLEDNFTEEEFRYLQTLQMYLKTVQDFILKGTKDQKPLGDPPYDDELYPLQKVEQSEDSQKKNEMNKDLADKAGSDESGQEDEEDMPDEVKQQQTLNTTLENDDLGLNKEDKKNTTMEKELLEKTNISPSKQQKRQSKIEAPKALKTKERSVDRGKSNKKKKSSKGAGNKLENVIDMDLNPQRNKYIPTRTMMQRLVMRASVLDPRDADALPYMEDIRPWIKRENKDIF